MFFFYDNKDIKINPKTLQHAYLAILSDDLESAKKVFEILDSSRSKWGLVLLDILKGFVVNQPTFFQIRNFLEIDLDFLIKNKKNEYVERILSSLDYLATINHEVYKYVARVMLENKYYNAAYEYLNKSKEIFYNDPELHFLYAKYFIKNNNKKTATFHLDECLTILNDYYPAILLKENLESILNN